MKISIGSTFSSNNISSFIFKSAFSYLMMLFLLSTFIIITESGRISEFGNRRDAKARGFNPPSHRKRGPEIDPGWGRERHKKPQIDPDWGITKPVDAQEEEKEEAKEGSGDFFKDNLAFVVGVAVIGGAVILVLVVVGCYKVHQGSIKNAAKAVANSSVGKTITEGATSLGHGAMEGAKAVGGLAMEGGRAVGDVLVDGTKAAGSLAVDGSKVVGKYAVEGGRAVVEGSKKVGSAAIEEGKVLGSAAVQGGRVVGGMAVDGTKAVGGLAVDGTKATGQYVVEGGRIVGAATTAGTKAAAKSAQTSMSTPTSSSK